MPAGQSVLMLVWCSTGIELGGGLLGIPSGTGLNEDLTEQSSLKEPEGSCCLFVIRVGRARVSTIEEAFFITILVLDLMLVYRIPQSACDTAFTT